MDILIKRNYRTTEVIDGQLFIDGSFRLCDTSENATTALPAGQYRVSIIKCKQHARKMPVILLHKDVVPSCDKCYSLDFVNNNTKMPVFCPQICMGNGVNNRTDGAIVVGKRIAPGCLKHSKETFTTIYERIRKSAERGHDLTLTIEEDYPIAPKEPTNFEIGSMILAQMGGKDIAAKHDSETKDLNNGRNLD